MEAKWIISGRGTYEEVLRMMRGLTGILATNFYIEERKDTITQTSEHCICSNREMC